MRTNNQIDTQDFRIWNGIYPSIKSILTTKQQVTAATSILVERDIQQFNQLAKLIKYRENYQNGVNVNYDYPLNVALSCLSRNNNSLTVIDFGGGLGLDYFKCILALPHLHLLEWHIVELPDIVRIGKELSQNIPSLHFHDSTPDGLKNLSCVHFGSSLQYISDWQSLLWAYKDLNPELFIFSDLLAGNIPTFASTQFFYGKEIPVWFLNLFDFDHFMSTLQYGCIYHSDFHAKLLGKTQSLPLSHFPETHRLKHTCHRIYAREP